MVLKMGTKMMSTKPLIKMKPAVLLFLISFVSGSFVLKTDILEAIASGMASVTTAGKKISASIGELNFKVRL